MPNRVANPATSRAVRGCVLAGGRSTRFGSDKALHPVDGVPMAVRVARVLAAAGLDPLLVVRHPLGLGLPELVEPDGPRHPLWGVAAALADGGAFFAPCDLVDLHVDQVRRLLAEGAVATAQPLLGVYPPTFRDRALRAALAGERVQDAIAGLPTLDVGAVANLNRPPSP